MIVAPPLQPERSEELQASRAAPRKALVGGTRHEARDGNTQLPSTNEIAAEQQSARIELQKLRQLARSWAAASGDSDRRPQAALFAKEALRHYAIRRRSSEQLSTIVGLDGLELDAPGAALAEVIGRQALLLPLAEAVHFITSLYTVLMAPRERSAAGAFYTPPALAERLVELAGDQGVDWSTARVLDPASGGGAFLLPVALRIVSAMDGAEPGFILRQLETRLLGLELDPFAAGLGQNALELFLADLCEAAGRRAPTLVRVADALKHAVEARFDLVIGNPPYCRTSLTAAQRQRFSRSLYGHANLYGVFTDLAVSWAAPGGIVAFLTPASFLGGHYYKALRSFLAEEAPPRSLDFVRTRSGVFEDVLQETVLATYERSGDRSRVQVHYVDLPDERTLKVVRNGTIALPASPDEPWLAPREPAHSPLVAAAEPMPARLSDWGYEVSTGPLVWNRHKKQLRYRPGPGVHPLIWAESITSEGRFVYRAEKPNHAPFFKMEPGDDWLLVTKPCVLLQRTTAKEQERRLIAAELPAEFIANHRGVVIENHLNMVRPTAAPKVSAAVVAAVLNSRIVDQLFRCINGSVAVSAYELEALPLPAPDRLAKLERLVAANAGAAAIEREICRFYAEGAA